MLKKILLLILAVLGAAVLLGAVGLTWAHLSIRRERAPLPPAQSLARVVKDGPLRVSFVNTASQEMPRSAVLDPKRDSHPAAAYVMSHAAFVLEWADGRILVIDNGMNREEAEAFGRPLELLAGAQPIRPLGALADRLGAAAARVQGVVFTHLHTDHVGGLADLCRGVGHPLRVFMTEPQAQHPNYTTRPGLRLIDAAGCARKQVLRGASPHDLDGFPGVAVIAAGGHTPGSQLIAVNTADGRRYLFAGDIVNNIDGINDDVPKPFLYRLLIVPEDEPRQTELRHYLRALRDQEGFSLLVSHDQRQIESTLAPFPG